MDEIALTCGDCLEILPTLASGSIDTIFADPPYGIGVPYATYDDTRDNLKKLIERFMPEFLRIAKRVVITPGTSNLWLYPEPTWCLSFVNPAGVGRSSWGFICWNPILVYGADPFLAHGEGSRPDTMFMRNSNDIDNNGHPCPKPFNVMRWIIERTTRQGELVLDPFMGSGTTGVACVQLGRHFMGIEMNPDYFALAEKRIAEARAQGNFLASIPDVKPTQPRLAL